MLSEYKLNYGLNMDAVIIIRSRNTNVTGALLALTVMLLELAGTILGLMGRCQN